MSVVLAGVSLNGTDVLWSLIGVGLPLAVMALVCWRLFRSRPPIQ